MDELDYAKSEAVQHLGHVATIPVLSQAALRFVLECALAPDRWGNAHSMPTLSAAEIIAAVCKAWRDAVLAWKSSVQAFSARPNNDTVLLALSDVFLSLRSIELSSCLSITGPGLLDFTRAVPSLTKLDLSFSMGLLPILPKLLSTATGIQTLRLSYASGSSSSEIDLIFLEAAPHGTSLTHLDLRCMPHGHDPYHKKDCVTISGLAGSLKFGFPALTHLQCPHGISPKDVLRMLALRPELKILIDVGSFEENRGENYYRAL